jgi:hypothetical protein
MEDRSLPRRRFAAEVVAGAFLGSSLAATSSAEAADGPERLAGRNDDRTSVDLFLNLIRAEYPTKLTDEQWAELRRHVEYHQARARLLRSLPIVNHDELPIVFRVLEA